jgi:hypothetical protein
MALPVQAALQWRMSALTRQKITFAEMRAAGVCSDYRCSHHLAISGDRWPDDIGIHP